MVFNVSRKDLEKLYKNDEISKILEIYSSCASEKEIELLKGFIKREHPDFTSEELSRFITTIVIDKVRNYNREEEYNNFVPMDKKVSKNTDYLTKEESTFMRNFKKEIQEFIVDNKNNISKENYIILRQIYNTKKDQNYLGIYNIQYSVDLLLEEGIPIGYKAAFYDKIIIINNFDYLLNKIVSCNDERQSYGSLLIKVPKEALDNKTIPIYYNNNGNIYLNPKYVICYVPVKERKILSVEINNSYEEFESNICEGEVLDKEIIKRY